MNVAKACWSDQENLLLMQYAAESKKGGHIVKWDKENIATLFTAKSLRQCQRQYARLKNTFFSVTQYGLPAKVQDVAQMSIGQKREASDFIDQRTSCHRAMTEYWQVDGNVKKSRFNSLDYTENAITYSEALEPELFSLPAFDQIKAEEIDRQINTCSPIQLSDKKRILIERLLPADTFLKAIASHNNRNKNSCYGTHDNLLQNPIPYSRALTGEELLY